MKPSRERRKLAVKLARDAVYKRDGAEYDESVNPYTEEREHRIFEKYYHIHCDMYHAMEAL